MRDAVLTAVADARKRLNLAIVAHRALAWAVPSAAAAAVAAAALRVAGLEAAGFLLWACLLAAGTAIGAVRGLASRMGTADAARWLDEALGENELLSAALVCISRGRSGRFDDEVLAKAEAQASIAAALRAPVRPTARKAALAAAALTASILAVIVARPLVPSFSDGSAALRRAALAREASAKASDSESESREAAAALAAALFPNDKRMAALAQRALREGRLDDFRDILRGADVDLSSRLDRTVSELEKKKLTRELDRIREAMNSIAAAADDEADRADRSEGLEGGEGEGGEPGEEEGLFGRGDTAPGGPGGPGGPEGAEPGNAEAEGGPGGGDGEADGSGGTSGGEGGGTGGEGWGSGSGSPRNWGKVEPRSGESAASLDLADDSSFFELVLPGEDAAAPLTSVLPSSRRSAESAMSREGVPLEYRDFVRSYFMALTKGATE